MSYLYCSRFHPEYKITCTEPRYKAVPVFPLLGHIGDAPVHWHEETFSSGGILLSEYKYGYYRKDSGEIYTYDVDPGTPVTIYDISQEYGAGEDRLYTFETWQEFVSAVQANERLLIQPYTLTIQDGVVTKIAEKFYN